MTVSRPIQFNPAESMLGILATARAVQHKKNEFVNVDNNIVLDCLLDELKDIEIRTVDNFEKAAERVWERVRPRIDLVSPDRMIKVFEASIDSVKTLRGNGKALMFKDVFPIRLMLCWIDALDMIINIYHVVLNKLYSKYLRDPSRYHGVFYGILMAIGILFTRVAEQSIAYHKLVETKQDFSDEQLDKFVTLLAKDMAYLVEIQSKFHLINNEQEPFAGNIKDFAEFQDFLLKNYGNPAA